MKLEDIREELKKLKKYAELLGTPDEFFRHMNGHATELSLVLSAFTIANESENILSALEIHLHSGGNVALTLEEMRTMEAEPVWIEVLDRPDLSRWHFIVRTSSLGLIAKDGLGQYECYPHNEDKLTFGGCYFDIEKGHGYGVKWLAYKHRLVR